MVDNNSNIYLWHISERYVQNFIGEYCRNSIKDRFVYKQGRRIDEVIEKPTVIFEKATKKQLQKYSSLASNLMIPLINDNIANTLMKIAPNNIQLMDVIVKAKDGELAGYKILNITIECDGLDENETICNYIPSTKHILGFDKFKYKKNCLENIDIARSKDYHGHLIVSEQIKNKLLNIDNLGVDFKKVS